jgi:AcrR family transcriptional regulator
MQHGVADATIAQITEAADVGFGTFYLYFPTKEALYRAVVHDGFAELGTRFDALLQEAEQRQDSWRATVHAGVDTFFRFSAERRDLFSLMFAGQDLGGAGMGGEVRARVLAWATAVVRAAAEAECEDQRHVDEDLIDILTFAVIATLRRTAVRWMRAHADFAADGTGLPVELACTQISRFIAAGLAAAICPDENRGDSVVPGVEGSDVAGA